MRRKLIIILIAAVVVVALALLAWWWFNLPTPAPTTPPTPATNQPVSVNTPAPAPAPTPTQPDPALGWRVLAMNFAERYGTYSTDLPFQNLKSLAPLLAPDFEQRVQAQLATNSAQPGFYSVTTRALIATTTATTSDSVQVNVATQRSERFSRDDTPRLSYPTLTVTLSQVGGQWLVDSAAWVKQ